MQCRLADEVHEPRSESHGLRQAADRLVDANTAEAMLFEERNGLDAAGPSPEG